MSQKQYIAILVKKLKFNRCRWPTAGIFYYEKPRNLLWRAF